MVCMWAERAKGRTHHLKRSGTVSGTWVGVGEEADGIGFATVTGIWVDMDQ